jgi:hypothetical protein
MTRPPELIISIPVEGAVSAYVTAQSSAEADALRNWLVSHEEDLRDQVGEVLDQVHLIRTKRPELDP